MKFDSGRETSEPSFKRRHVVALVGFAAFFLLNVHRMNMTVSIVAMVNYSSSVTNTSIASQSCPELLYEQQEDNKRNVTKTSGEFDWSPELQGYILGSAFVGYAITQVLAGKLSEIYGCKWILFGAILVASITTFITPFASWWNVYVLIVVQTIRGMAQGMYPPAISVMMANWFPTLERGFLSTFMMSGFGAGAVAGGLITGYLCESPSAGWPVVFYFCGAVGLALALVIAVFIYENPSAHPNIHKNELKYILDNQEAKLDRKRPKTPWKSILTSIPMYSLVIAMFGANWAGTYFISIHPTFLGTILHFSISQNGLLTSMPFILQTLFTLIASAASNIMNKNGRVSIDKTRKFWNSTACLGFSACLLGIYFAGCNRTIIIFLSFIAMGCVGFSFAGCVIASADMSPVFAGTIMGITCTFGTSASFILPVIFGLLTEGKQTLEQWKKIFGLTIGIVMVSGIVFCFLGSAEIQKWNYTEEKKSKDDKKQTTSDHCETQT